jgi:hypothetical protein
MAEHEELPAINWHAKLAPGFDRRDQLRLYADNVSREAAKRQVRLTREALPKRKREAN